MWNEITALVQLDVPIFLIVCLNKTKQHTGIMPGNCSACAAVCCSTPVCVSVRENERERSAKWGDEGRAFKFFSKTKRNKIKIQAASSIKNASLREEVNSGNMKVPQSKFKALQTVTLAGQC